MTKAITDVTTLKGLLQQTGLTGATMGKMLGGAGIGAVAIGLGLAVKSAAEFEAKLSGIKAVSGATAGQMVAVRKEALALGQATVFSASDAAGAMEELIKAGLSVQDVLHGAAKATVSLAAAGGIPLKEAATIAANAMNAFALSAGDMPGIADIIAGTANASAIDVGQFAESLQQAGAVSHLTGLSFKDMAAAIGIMGNAGIVGSDAGTSLKTMLQNLIPVTEKQKGLFQELGLTTEDGSNKFFDAQGNIKSFAQVSQVLQNALKGQTAEQKLSNLQLIFGSDALRASAIAATAGAKGVNAFTKEMGKTTAAEVAAERMDNLKGSVENLMGSLDTLGITVGTALLGPLRSLVDMMTTGVNSISGGADELLSQVTPVFESLGAAFANVIDLVGQMASDFAPLITLFVQLGVGIPLVILQQTAAALETLTGILNDHATAVEAVLAAYLILSSRGLAGLVSMLTVRLAPALLTAKLQWISFTTTMSAGGGMAAITGGLRTAATAAAGLAASLGPAVVLAAALYFGIKAWQDYRDSVKETNDALDAADRAMSSTSITAIQTQIKALDELIAKRKESANKATGAEIGAQYIPVLGPIVGEAIDKFKLQPAIDQADELGQAAEDLKQHMIDVGQGAVRFSEAFGSIDASKAEQLMSAISEGDPKALAEAAGIIKDLKPQLEAAGVSMREFKAATVMPRDTIFNRGQYEEWRATSGSAMDDIILKMHAFNDPAATTARAVDDLTQAFEDTATGEESAADAAKGLKDAWDGLIGSAVDAARAQDDFQNKLKELSKAADDAKASYNGVNDQSIKLRETTLDAVDSLGGLLTAGGKVGPELAAQFAQGYQAIVKAGTGTASTHKEMVEYLKTLNLSPKEVSTVVQAIGVANAKQQMEDLIGQYNLSPGKVSSIIEAAGAKTAIEQYKAIKEYADGLDGRDVNTNVNAMGAPEAKSQMEDLIHQYNITPAQVKSIITASGASTAQGQLRAILDYLNGINGKNAKAYVTTTYTHIGVPPSQLGSLYGINGADGFITHNGMIAMASGGYMPGIYMGTRVKFAEAGDEAYIPMRPDKRRRSEALLEQVARAFGGAFVKNAMVKMASGYAPVAPFPIGVPPRSTTLIARTPGQIRKDYNFHTYFPKKERTSDALQAMMGRMSAMGIFGEMEDWS